jgi:hypothetical protein
VIVSMSLRCLAIAVALLVGCFSDAPPVEDDDDGGTTSSEPCTPGTLGCACGPDGCGAGLECAPGLDLCQDEGCNPGTAGCMCLEDDCVGEAVCVGGFCVAPAGTTGASASADDSNDVDATGVDVTDTTASADTLGDDAVGDTTSGPMCPSPPLDETCKDQDTCMACIDCVLDGPCVALHQDCDEGVCEMVYDCIQTSCGLGDGNDPTACIATCCTDNGCTDDKPGCLQFQALAVCVEAHCDQLCAAEVTCPAVSCAE